MIAVEKFGSNFMGALGYNLKKLNNPDERKRAELLASTFSSLSAGMIRKEVDMIKSLRPALKKHVWHTSLNFSKDENPDNLSNEKLVEIGLEYMKAMGYDDNQHMIIRHHDAEHPHIHLLVNRIRLDGTVVSDSNNFRKSQSALRRIEKQYDLIPLQGSKNISGARNDSISAELYQDRTEDNFSSVNSYTQISGDVSNKLSQRALTKNEIEKSIRTGTSSDKALLQAILDPIIYKHEISLGEFIKQCNESGVSLLFNQASTGRVSGITYFINDFKIKGQSLGNRFKWAEIVKYIDYEQDRDSKVVSAANGRTKERFGDFTAGAIQENSGIFRGRITDTSENSGIDAEQRSSQLETAARDARREFQDQEQPIATGEESGSSAQRVDIFENNNRDSDIDYLDDSLQGYPVIEISDDVDDEAINGRNRHRKGRNNRR